MQRLSLGSSAPSSKLVKDDQFASEIEKPIPSPSSAATLVGGVGPLYGGRKDVCGEEGEDLSKNRVRKLRADTTPQSETYIHVIPILTLFCFLILYLFSHYPSQNDLAQFSGFKRTSSDEIISELQGVSEIKKGEVVAMRSLKNLAESAGLQRRRHRKMAVGA